MPKLFQDPTVLVECLKKKSATYPLIVRLYLQLIEKYSNFKFDDWLLLPYFHQLYFFENNQLYRENLENTERDLKSIQKCLGCEEFERLCQEILDYAKHPTVDGIREKLLSFYCELKAMTFFINKGYSRIERIPRSESKTADFRATNNSETVVVECKCIHASKITNYEYKSNIGPNLVSIENQAFFLVKKVHEFFKNYVPKVVEAAISQLDASVGKNETHKKCVYLLIELDSEYNVPFDEVLDAIENTMKAESANLDTYFKDKYEENINIDCIVLYVFSRCEKKEFKWFKNEVQSGQQHNLHN